MSRLPFPLVLLALAASAWARPAVACSTCGCGDPTLTTLGAEKPYPWRVRAAVAVGYRSDHVGVPNVDQVNLRELRTDAYLAVAPTSHLFLQLGVPVVARTVQSVSGAKSTAVGLGDVELRVKPFVLQDREFMPRHLLAFLGGVKIPTAQRQRGPDRQLLPIEVQPGTGSVDPILGASYAFFARPWSVYASLTFTAPAWSRDELRASPSLRTATVLQYQVLPQLAFRGGLDTRVDGKAIEGGQQSRDSGGVILFASPEVVVSPHPDWILALAVRIPFANALVGSHTEGPLLGFTVAHDF